LTIQKTSHQNIIIDIEPDASVKQGFVSLPLNQEGFKDFISSLLGKPQELSRSFYGSFEIHKNDIINIYHLLEQRIKQQNVAELVQFTVKISYDDDSSVTMSSLEEFKTYNELRKVISTSINVYWSYLVKFADREFPEKQEIELIIISDHYSNNKMSFLNDKRNIIRFKNEPGRIMHIINHTARSWGNDIDSLLTLQVKSCMDESKRTFISLLSKYKNSVSIFGGILFLLISIVGCILTTSKFADYSLSKVNDGISSSSSLDDKVNFISQYIAAGEWLSFNQFITVVLIASATIAIFIGVIFDLMIDDIQIQSSFLCLTEESLKYKESIKRESNKGLWKFIISFVTSVIAGVVGNYVFQLLVTTS